MKIINNLKIKVFSVATMMIMVLGITMLTYPYEFKNATNINANIHDFSILSLVILSITWYLLALHSAFVEAPEWLKKHFES